MKDGAINAPCTRVIRCTTCRDAISRDNISTLHLSFSLSFFISIALISLQPVHVRERVRARSRSLLPTFHPLTVTMQLFQPRDDGVGGSWRKLLFESLPELLLAPRTLPRTRHYPDNLIIVSLTAVIS